ncbi:MAG TPA: hypothetical protein DIW81_19935 [Planctomycetaceae bacterium]|nr:hypothetical protein [Planctomycetaceae bacterium]
MVAPIRRNEEECHGPEVIKNPRNHTVWQAYSVKLEDSRLRFLNDQVVSQENASRVLLSQINKDQRLRHEVNQH